MTAKKSESKQEVKFTKEQILVSKKYENRRDAVNAVWTDDSLKSITEVDTLLEKFMKGKVK